MLFYLFFHLHSQQSNLLNQARLALLKAKDDHVKVNTAVLVLLHDVLVVFIEDS